ncbi:MAG: hypothetical protein Q4B31_04945 [Clostridia bacterium]|nr:hypothetical protein [Clostridia bacterium]
MKKRTVFVLSVLLTVVISMAVFLSVFLSKNWNTVLAIIDSFRYSNEQIQQQLQQNKNDVETFLKNENGIEIRDVTDEEAKALSEGELTEEELVDILVGNTPSPTPEATATPQPGDAPQATVAPTPTSTPTPKPTPTPNPQEAAKQRVAELIAKLYVEKSIYLGKLDAIEAKIIDIYHNMHYTEQPGAKEVLFPQYLPEVAAWEKECDAIVSDIIAEIRENLVISGQDVTIADTLEAAYQNEKKAKKTYFINRYMD